MPSVKALFEKIDKQPLNSMTADDPSPMVIGQRISTLKSHISHGYFKEGFDLCLQTINGVPCIDRAAWFKAVLDFSSCALSLKKTLPSVDTLFSRPTWEHFYSDGLALRLQSALLYSNSDDPQPPWKSILLEALYQEHVSTDAKVEFQFLRGLDESIKSRDVCASNTEEMFFQLIDCKPDLSIILWYILRPVAAGSDVTKSFDLVLPESRLKAIIRVVARIFREAPFLTDASEVCQLDAIVFLLALSISYLIRYASSSDVLKYQSPKTPSSWPPAPLCLASQSSLTHFLDQLRFVAPNHATSPRLTLRVAWATSHLPLDSGSDESTSWAARIWEAGLAALVQDPEFVQKNSPALSIGKKSERNTLFPTELNSNWWYGSHVEVSPGMINEDHAWFYLGWRWLALYWLEHPPAKLETVLNHLHHLEGQQFPIDPECALLAGKLVNKNVVLDSSSAVLKPLGCLALTIMDAASKVPLKLATSEESSKLTKAITDEIASLQANFGLPSTSAPHLEELSAKSPAQLQTTNMPSGYGAYSNGGRKSSFGLMGTPSSRVSGIFTEDGASSTYPVPRSSHSGAVSATPASAVSDTQTKLMTQVVEQWMPSFMEFSRTMSETSAELAKSRMQNEELSRLLKETRSQLDAAIAEQRQQQQQRSQTPPKPPTSPPRPVPSLEDWRALQESLREVASSLRDFRQWFPTAVPPPTHIPPPPPPPMLRPGDMFSLESQQNAQLALSQLAAFHQQQAPQTTPGPCLLLPHLSRPPPPLPPSVPVDFRVPPMPPCLFPPGVSTPGTVGALQQASIPKSPDQSAIFPTASTAAQQPTTSVKSPATIASSPSGKVATPTKNTTSTAKQDIPSTASPPTLFTFKPPTTTAQETNLFSFSKIGSPGSVGDGPNSTPLFTNFSFDLKQSSAAKSASTQPPQPLTTDTSKHTDDDDNPEAFEPTVEVAPCFDKLPELVKQTTGEEDERLLFCQRARLFRWDKSETSSSGEWKARGTGELKVLADDKAVKFRIVMRRDQIMKLCANHYILPGINLRRHPQKPVACMWGARDFAVLDVDNAKPDGSDEVFMVQFKTEEITDEFEKVVKSCLDKVSTAGSLATTETSHASKSLEETKPKPGSWKCTACGVFVDPAVEKCSACNAPRPGAAAANVPLSGLDKFKPKAGSWNCPTCALVVAPDLNKCPACETVKPGAKPVPTTPAPSTANFCSSTPTLTAAASTTKTTFIFGSSSNTQATAIPKFSFGSTPKTTISESSKPATTSTFSFGMPSFSSVTAAIGSEKPKFSFGKPSSDPKLVGGGSGAFAALDLTESLEKPKFDFTFVAKPTTSVKNEVDGEQDDDEEGEVTPSDLSQVSFKPIFDHLPDKVEVRTGEEDEEVVFEARAKLFRFDSGAWKERGLGQLKLLRTPDSGRVRIVMRREQVHKVCCNHPITPGMRLKPLEGSQASVKPWVWWAVDFSDDEVGPEGKKEMFSVRFKTTEESQAFYNAFTEVAESTGSDLPGGRDDAATCGDDDLVIIEESSVSPEQVARARALQLPDDFYAYELKTPGSSRHSHQEEMTPAEEAEEDELLEEAVNRRFSQSIASSNHEEKTGDTTPTPVVSGSSSLVIIKNSDVPKSPTSPPASLSDVFRVKSGSWTCGTCMLCVDPDKTTCPACNTAKPTADKTPQKDQGTGGVTSDTPASGGSSIFSALAFGAHDSGGGFEALSKEAGKTSSWLTSGSASSHTWAGAESTLFGATGDGGGGSSDENQENDPDPHFEPIFPIPDLVETKTGEEGEICLFLRRCKLYRLVDGQWKERGIGDMKILVHPNNPLPENDLDPRTELPLDKEIDGGISYARLLMRRDQVLKICVNHTISLDMPQFKPLTVANNAICWVAKDFSEDAAGEVMTLGLKCKVKPPYTGVKRVEMLPSTAFNA
ncbi:unnamed protein product [Mesocestoides corti]|uniref:RanBD1 domain-containing protein n=1 Tax=Mesocestoides corti TaxID=53468 RepID=A0A0R3UGJ7_MESCO|nr:unnamed protein product [Mesocestoides corti]